MQDVQLKRHNDKLIELLSLKENDKLLDIGSGNCHLQIKISSIVKLSENVAIEANQAMIDKAMDIMTNENITILKLQIDPSTPIPYEDNQFDVTMSSRVLCNIYNQHQILKEMQRVTKPGGKVINTCPDFNSLSSNALSITSEYILKIFIRNSVGFPQELTKNSLRTFKMSGLVNPVNYVEPVFNNEGYSNEIIHELRWQVKEIIPWGLGWMYNIIDWLVVEPLSYEVKQKTLLKEQQDMWNIIITVGQKPEKGKNFKKKEKELEKVPKKETEQETENESDKEKETENESDKEKENEPENKIETE